MVTELKPQSSAMIRVVHLIGGQTLIGSLVRGPAHTPYMNKPYEVMVFPAREGSRTQITLVKLGTLMGAMPQLGIEDLELPSMRTLGLPIAPDPQLAQAYIEALEREANPVTPQQIADHLHHAGASSAGSTSPNP